MLRTHTITDPAANPGLLRTKRYGVIETAGGRLLRVRLRPWPHVLSLRELWPLSDRHHAAGPADRCWLYYNQPRSASQFLALKYVVTTHGTSYRTFRAALETLDLIAELKNADAILCDAANHRLSDRFLRRQGYVPHAPMPWRRNYIRRLYEERAATPA